MDSVNLEMREKLDQVSAGWEDGIGSPMIININPDMLPVMVAAVSREGYSGARLNDYVEDSVLAELESIEGVASVSSSGGVTETVEVTISKQKLNAVNERIRKVIRNKFKDAREELDKAKTEIEDGLKKVEEGQQEVDEALEKISSGNEELAKQMAKARADVDEKKSALSDAKLALNMQLSELKTQKTQLQQTRTTVEQLKNARDTLIKQIDDTKQALVDLEELIAAYNKAKDTMQGFEEAIAKIQADDSLTEEQKEEAIAQIKGSAEYIAAEQNLEALEAQLEAQGFTPETLERRREELQSG